MATAADKYDQALRCHQTGDYPAAEKLYAEIIDSWLAEGANPTGTNPSPPHPAMARVHYNLGNVLHLQGRLDEAVGAYRQALVFDPGHVRAHNNLGIALKELGMLTEAAASFREAARVNPGYLECHYNLGNTLMDHGARTERGPAQIAERLREAVASFGQALKLDPDHVSARCNLATTLKRLGDLDQALVQFEHVLARNPGHAVAAWSRSLVRLLQGDFASGWQDYERRLEQPNYKRRTFAQPLWDGSPLGGKTVFAYEDGGWGDLLQFVRYAPLIKERGGVVLFECPARLVELLSTAPGIDCLVPRGAPLPAYDVQVPLMSLPRVFGANLTNIPAQVPYLHADPGLISHWSDKLNASFGPGLRVGIAWQGNPSFGEDFYRSIPVSHFECLARVPTVRLVKLQKEPNSEPEQELVQRLSILDLSGHLDAVSAFTDTAALMMNLDLIVTSDTAVAHLAGALGRPVWVLLPMVPEWRWLRDRPDSPWYPTMRLFRQTRSAIGLKCFSAWPTRRVASALLLVEAQVAQEFIKGRRVRVRRTVAAQDRE